MNPYFCCKWATRTGSCFPVEPVGCGEWLPRPPAHRRRRSRRCQASPSPAASPLRNNPAYTKDPRHGKRARAGAQDKKGSARAYCNLAHRRGARRAGAGEPSPCGNRSWITGKLAQRTRGGRSPGLGTE